MPKQVYVFPGNINEVDLTEGIRSVLEPAVDTVYTFDQTAGTYVDVNNAANAIPDEVYVSSPAFYSTSTNPVVNNKFHHNGPLPTDSAGLPILPFVHYPGYLGYRYSVIKHDPASPNGITEVTTGSQTVNAYTANVPAYVKVLWDTAASTIFIVIRDPLATDSNSYNRGTMTNQVVALISYDKAADSISIIQSINDQALLRKFPISNLLFYYDSVADQYTFYEPMIGPGGSLEMRKITATQAAITQTFEPISVSGSAYTPSFPDAMSNPAPLFFISGLDVKRPWTEITSPLETNTSQFTVALLQSANITIETSARAIASQLDLAFIRGQYSYDSATSSWTLTVSSEFLAPSVFKNLYTKNIKYLNSKDGVAPLTTLSTSNLYSYAVPYYIKTLDIQGITSYADINAESVIYHQQGNGIRGYTKEYYSYSTTGESVLYDWEPHITPATGNVLDFLDVQIDHTSAPEVLFASTGYNLFTFVKVTDQQILTNLATFSGKYLYDISQSSTKSQKYYVIHRTQSLKHYPYVSKGQPLPNLAKKIVIISDPDKGGLNGVPGMMAPSEQSTVTSGTALNTAAGGTITSVYKRDANGLESLVFWVRSGTTMYTTFTVHFERNLNVNSIAKYIYDNSNVDPIHVLISRNFEGTDVKFTSPLYAHFTYINSTSDYWPTPVKARVSMKKAGYYNSEEAGKGTHVYFDSVTGQLVNDDVEDATDLVLSSLPIRGYISLGGSNWYRHKPVQLMTTDGQFGLIFSNYFIQPFKDFWTADYEDTIEITVGTSVYRYVVIGKVTIDNSPRIVAALEDVV